MISLAEFPGIFVSAILINTRGRKQTLAIMLAVYAFFSSLLLVPGPTGLGTFFACVSRGAMLGAYATVYVYLNGAPLNISGFVGSDGRLSMT